MPASQSTPPTRALTGDKTFYDRFAANMHTLGLPAPRNWFDSSMTTTVSIERIAKAVQHFGTKVTMREILLTVPALASAGAAAEFTLAASAVFATAYLAACVGSLLVATGQGLSAQMQARASTTYGLPPQTWQKMPHVTVRLQLAGRGQR